MMSSFLAFLVPRDSKLSRARQRNPSQRRGLYQITPDAVTRVKRAPAPRLPADLISCHRGGSGSEPWV